MTKTKFRALRNFLLRPGVDVRAGEVLELTDEEASLFVAMPHTIEPVNRADRQRIVSTDRIVWETTEEKPPGRRFFSLVSGRA